MEWLKSNEHLATLGRGVKAGALSSLLLGLRVGAPVLALVLLAGRERFSGDMSPGGIVQAMTSTDEPENAKEKPYVVVFDVREEKSIEVRRLKLKVRGLVAENKVTFRGVRWSPNVQWQGAEPTVSLSQDFLLLQMGELLPLNDPLHALSLKAPEHVRRYLAQQGVPFFQNMALLPRGTAQKLVRSVLGLGTLLGLSQPQAMQYLGHGMHFQFGWEADRTVHASALLP